MGLKNPFLTKKEIPKEIKSEIVKKVATSIRMVQKHEHYTKTKK
jgi:hypothetical protein